MQMSLTHAFHLCKLYVQNDGRARSVGPSTRSAGILAGSYSGGFTHLPLVTPSMRMQNRVVLHREKSPRCIIIAGPNGAGKTTFAREFLPKDAGVIHFVNADLIAGGLSPLRPELAALAGGRLFLAELDRLAQARVDFAFESTLSGLAYLRRLRHWKAAGYRIEVIFLRLPSPRLALRRIASRVRQGGHDVPRADVVRRFARSWTHFHSHYLPLADVWTVYDNSGARPVLIEQGP